MIKSLPSPPKTRCLQHWRCFSQLLGSRWGSIWKFPRNRTRRTHVSRTPKPGYLIARSHFTERGPLGFGPIQFLMENIWVLLGVEPKIMVPPNHPFVHRGFSIINHPFLRVFPLFLMGKLGDFSFVPLFWGSWFERPCWFVDLLIGLKNDEPSFCK